MLLHTSILKLAYSESIQFLSIQASYRLHCVLDGMNVLLFPLIEQLDDSQLVFIQLFAFYNNHLFL
jgi:hypothetical protein